MKNVLRDTAIIGLITMASMLLPELTLRIVFSEPGAAETRGMAYDANDDYLLSLRPNRRTPFRRSRANGGATVIWETNSLGFRGHELKAHPDIRVMVYGDSNIQAPFTALEETFPYKLERYLTAQLPDTAVEVVNSGIQGFGPDQSLIKLSTEVDVHHPDLILLHIFADNDFGDIVRNRLFDVDGQGALVPTHFNRTRDELLADHAIGQSTVNGFLSSLFIVRAAQKIATTYVTHLISRAEREYAVYKLSQPMMFSQLDDHYDIDVALYPESESSKVKIRLMEAVLRQAQKVTMARNIALLVVIGPSVIDLTENFTVGYKELQKYPGYKRDNLSGPIDAICARLDIPRVNLFTAFMGNRPEDLYFKSDDNHWNDRGQDLAAQVTAAYMAERMLEGSARRRAVGGRRMMSWTTQRSGQGLVPTERRPAVARHDPERR